MLLATSIHNQLAYRQRQQCNRILMCYLTRSICCWCTRYDESQPRQYVPNGHDDGYSPRSHAAQWPNEPSTEQWQRAYDPHGHHIGPAEYVDRAWCQPGEHKQWPSHEMEPHEAKGPHPLEDGQRRRQRRGGRRHRRPPPAPYPG